jgi:hypothetical protein
MKQTTTPSICAANHHTLRCSYHLSGLFDRILFENNTKTSTTVTSARCVHMIQAFVAQDFTQFQQDGANSAFG